VAPQLGSGKLEPEDFRFVGYLQNQMVVHANEIQGCDAERGSSGSLGGAEESDIRTSRDKIRRLPERCQDNLEAETHLLPSGKQAKVIYVGDSDTDLECLLAADCGIYMQDEPLSSSQTALNEIMTRLHIPSQHVDQLEVNDGDTHRLWWARDFDEVRAALERCGVLSNG